MRMRMFLLGAVCGAGLLLAYGYWSYQNDLERRFHECMVAAEGDVVKQHICIFIVQQAMR